MCVCVCVFFAFVKFWKFHMLAIYLDKFVKWVWQIWVTQWSFLQLIKCISKKKKKERKHLSQELQYMLVREAVAAPIWGHFIFIYQWSTVYTSQLLKIKKKHGGWTFSLKHCFYYLYSMTKLKLSNHVLLYSQYINI